MNTQRPFKERQMNFFWFCATNFWCKAMNIFQFRNDQYLHQKASAPVPNCLIFPYNRKWTITHYQPCIQKIQSHSPSMCFWSSLVFLLSASICGKVRWFSSSASTRLKATWSRFRRIRSPRVVYCVTLSANRSRHRGFAFREKRN